MADETGEAISVKPPLETKELKEIAGEWLSRFENHPTVAGKLDKKIEETPVDIKKLIQDELRKRPLSDTDIDEIAHHFTQKNNELALLKMISGNAYFMKFFIRWTPEELTGLLDKTTQYTIRRIIEKLKESEDDADAQDNYIKALKTVQGKLHPV